MPTILKNAKHYIVVYKWRDKLFIKTGRFSVSGTFVVDDNPHGWMTRVPRVPMHVYYNKVLCKDVSQIPEAIELLKKRCGKYCDGLIDQAYKAAITDFTKNINVKIGG